MQYNRWNDQNILEALQSNERARVNAAFRELYLDGKLRGAVWQQVRLLGGTDDDAREVFNMALAAFDRHVRENTYDPAQSRIATFVVNIARQMYHTRRRSESRRMAAHDRSMEGGGTEVQINPEQEMNRRHRKTLLEKATAELGDKCRQSLRLFSLDYSMAEIAEQMQYKSPDVAKMAVHDCRKRLHAYLTQHPALLAELREL